jgi:hypothetical protein
MWDEHKRERFHVLRQGELDGTLTTAEHAELAQMIHEIESAEAAALRVPTEQLRAERTRLEAENQALQAVVQRKEAFAMRLQSLLTEMEAERQAIDEELARILGQQTVPR